MCDAPWHHRNCALVCYSNTLKWWWHLTHGCVLMLIEYILRIMERYRVVFGRAESALILVHVWIWMCHYLAHDTQFMTPLLELHTCLLFKHTTTAVAYGTRVCADFYFVWTHILRMYGTVSCRHLTNRKYVGIGACLNLNVPFLGVRIMANGSALVLMLIEYMGPRRFGLARTASTCMFEFDAS